MFKILNSKPVDLDKRQHKLEQHSRKECLEFSGIPSLVPLKHLQNLVICVSQEIRVKLDSSHWVGETGRTIVKFFYKKYTEIVLLNEKKFKDLDTFCLFSNDIQDKQDLTRRCQNEA